MVLLLELLLLFLLLLPILFLLILRHDGQLLRLAQMPRRTTAAWRARIALSNAAKLPR